MPRARLAPSLSALFLLGCPAAPPSPDATVDAAFDASAEAAADAPRNYVPEPFAPTAATRAYCAGHDDDALEARITGLLAQLTPAEKVALLAGAALGRVEGVWLVRGNTRRGIPAFRMIDGARGAAVVPPGHATAFPVGMLRGASWDPALEERVGQAIAEEVLAAGANVVLAPTVNLLRHPRWGRAQETYGEDSWHLGSLALGFVRGAQARGVLTSVKHFAANSIENTRHTVDVRMDERTLREVYTPHFRRVVQEGNVATVMSAYNQLNGSYCDLNAHLLTDLLRTEWGFAGPVLSDWVLGTHGDVDSLRAGLDLEMPSPLHYSELGGALAAGTLREAEVDRSVRRLLRAQLCFDLDRRAFAEDPTMRETAAHLALAREAAARGLVLLRNESVQGRAVLPLAPSRAANIVVLGRAADVANTGDHGSSDVPSSRPVTALAAVRERAALSSGAVTFLPGATLDAAGESALRAADVVLFFSGNLATDEGESELGAGDRRSLSLPDAEVALLHRAAALNPRVVVVLEGGSAFLTADWDAEVPALLWAGYPGTEGGHALVDVLWGDRTPSGRLPFTMPTREEDLPPWDNTSPVVTYGYLHGYRYLQSNGTAARYPFGFGLGYSVMRYDSASPATQTVSAEGTVRVTVQLTNTGSRSMRETAQLYGVSADPMPAVPPTLRAFAQLELQGGAQGSVELSFPARELGHWDDAARAWVVPAGMYELRVGPNAALAAQRVTVQVQ